MANAITVRGLEKSYGTTKAVRGVDLDVESGSLFAFLGVNGAGKSTTINMLCTLLKPDAGTIEICGYDAATQADEVRRNIGVVFQNSVLDSRLTVRENLTVRAAFYGVYGAECKRRLEYLDGLLSLKELYGRPYGKLSGGQRRRVDLARGLINTPKLLFLDEPTTGLDPQTRKAVWSAVKELQSDAGMTVFLTTHYMEEAAEADNVVIIDEGKVVAAGTPIELKNKYSGDYVKLYMPSDPAAEAELGGMTYSYDNGCYRIAIKDSLEAIRFLDEHRSLAADFEVVKGNMDDVFLNVTGKRLGGGNNEE